MPPAAVTNLSAAGADFHSVDLNWTATGDDASAGRAAFYDVRYATSPITNATWDAAVPVLAEPGPSASGATEGFAVRGLDPATTYYFALKVRDNMGNESALSNAGSATTAAAATVFSDAVEGGTNGWTASGLWHQSTLRSTSPSTAWYYGIEQTQTYDTGTPNSGILTSPPIDLRNVEQPVLIWREWREMEDVSFLDSAVVQVSVSPNKWTTLYQSEFSTSPVPGNWHDRAAGLGWNLPPVTSEPQWVSRGVDLSPFVGKTVHIRFAFDTIDAFFNDFEGWHIDDVNVFANAPAGSAPTPLHSMEVVRGALVRSNRTGGIFESIDTDTDYDTDPLFTEAASRADS